MYIMHVKPIYIHVHVLCVCVLTCTHTHTHTHTQRLHAKDEASGRLGEANKDGKTKKKKPKMGMLDSFKFLLQQVGACMWVCI
jgi:hypothetical protein